MRKPKDFDAELKVLDDKARLLRTRKLQQLGELVVATGADATPIEILAGALLAAADAKDSKLLEGWRTSGANFFRGARHTSAGAAQGRALSVTGASDTLPLDRTPGA